MSTFNERLAAKISAFSPVDAAGAQELTPLYGLSYVRGHRSSPWLLPQSRSCYARQCRALARVMRLFLAKWVCA